MIEGRIMADMCLWQWISYMIIMFSIVLIIYYKEYKK